MVGLSLAEKKYLSDGISQGLRCDGRGLHDFRSFSVDLEVIPQVLVPHFLDALFFCSFLVMEYSSHRTATENLYSLLRLANECILWIPRE